MLNLRLTATKKEDYLRGIADSYNFTGVDIAGWPSTFKTPLSEMRKNLNPKMKIDGALMNRFYYASYSALCEDIFSTIQTFGMNPDFKDRPVHTKNVDQAERERLDDITMKKIGIKSKLLSELAERSKRDENGVDSIVDEKFYVDFSESDEDEDMESGDTQEKWLLVNIDAEVEAKYMLQVVGKKPCRSNFGSEPDDDDDDSSTDELTNNAADEAFKAALASYDEAVAAYKRTRFNLMLREYLT